MMLIPFLWMISTSLKTDEYVRRAIVRLDLVRIKVLLAGVDFQADGAVDGLVARLNPNFPPAAGEK